MAPVNDDPGARPHEHAGLAAELRALALLALDRLDPLLAGLPADGAPACTSCPVCAALAAVRGERPELAARLARHATGLAAALRETLAAAPDVPGAPEPRPARPVQHIPVERVRGGVGSC